VTDENRWPPESEFRAQFRPPVIPKKKKPEIKKVEEATEVKASNPKFFEQLRQLWATVFY
jgi:hypothetical protein